MTKNWKPSSTWLDRKVKHGFRGYPVATVAFYGPTAETATKIAVGIFKEENLEADPFERWFCQESDIRLDTVIGEQIAAFIKAQDVRSVVVTDGIIGCPHEEGVDYPEGKSCSQCPYWAGRDRWTLERIQ